MSIHTGSWPRPHRLTIEEYHRMADAGVLAPDARVELIDGEIIDMAPIGNRHAAAVDYLARQLILALREQALVRIQGPVELGANSEPQPDLAVLRPQADGYTGRCPTARDVLLLIEVSDSTLRFDRDLKAKFYARHRVSELWIVDLVHRKLHQLRDPRRGEYATLASVEAGVLSIPEVAVAVDLSSLFADSTANRRVSRRE